MMVSGRTIATTSRTDGNQRQSQTNKKRSVLLRCGRSSVRRRSTLTCCRKTRFSASSVALALKREARIPRISLNRSVIRMRAYAVRPLRLRRIEFSVHTGAPRIHGELLKLGIDIGQTSVAKYMVKRRGPPSQGWKTFLHNHADGIAAMDLFVVPTISFRLLYGLLIMGHGRRQILWFGVTANPTAEWIADQVTEACGWEQAPRYLIRDRDGAYGEVLIRRLRLMGIRDRPTSPRSPRQNGYAERLIGSIRRECLDRVVVLSERHLRHLLLSYMKYCNGARPHLSLAKDAPVSRAVDRAGHILCRPTLGGLHHQYARI